MNAHSKSSICLFGPCLRLYQVNGWEFFLVCSAAVQGEATGAVMTTQAVVMYKNLEAPVYWQCWLEHTRMRTSNSIHTFVCFSQFCTVLVLLLWSCMLGTQVRFLLCFFSSYRSVCCTALNLMLLWRLNMPTPCTAKNAIVTKSDKESNAFTSHHPIFWRLHPCHRNKLLCT